jgi:predicted AlkP superfamily pyrophosphatase or phosphodiesterase
MYTADGRKIPDIWTEPSELREHLQKLLGRFPLFKFWGPATSIESTRWLADAALAVDKKLKPNLTFIYLPHLDYNFQRLGPADPRCQRDLREVDAEVGKLLDHYSPHAAIILLSEYGITSVSRPIHINRLLRKLNLISTRLELGREMPDFGDSQAFAVADHQIAHVYVSDPAVVPLIVRELEATPGIAHVYAGDARRTIDLDHPRSGEIIALAEPDAWFTYYYWLDDKKAPDFARTVDIHRKPGYDPVELFLDPKLRSPKLKIATTLLKRKLGLRSLLDVIPLDATLVRGSHGVAPRDPADGAMIASNRPDLLLRDDIAPTDVCGLILDHLMRA